MEQLCGRLTELDLSWWVSWGCFGFSFFVYKNTFVNLVSVVFAVESQAKGHCSFCRSWISLCPCSSPNDFVCFVVFIAHVKSHHYKWYYNISPWSHMSEVIAWRIISFIASKTCERNLFRQNLSSKFSPVERLLFRSKKPPESWSETCQRKNWTLFLTQ